MQSEPIRQRALRRSTRPGVRRAAVRWAGLAFGTGLGLCLAWMWLWRAGPAQAAVVLTDCTPAELEAAVSAGGAISFDCPATPATIALTRQLVVTQAATIDGDGQVILSGGHITRVFNVLAGGSLTLSNLTVRDGNAGSGGGGAILSSGPLVITNVNFISNTAETGGAILHHQGPASFYKVEFTDNYAAEWGGAFDNNSSSLVTFRQSVFRGNLAGDFGGAIDADNGQGLLIDGSTFINNRALGGCCGAIFVIEPFTLTNSTLYSNTALLEAGAAWIEERARLENVTLHANQAGLEGGALYFNAPATLSRLDVYSNTAEAGGGIWALKGLTLTQVALYQNVALTGAGGGLYASGGAQITLVATAVYSNAAPNASGGGVFANTGGVRLIVNSTFSGNSAQTAGALLIEAGGASATITNSTFYGNSAAAANHLSGTLTLRNSLLAGSSTNNCGGAVTSLGYNLETGSSCGFSATGDQTGIADALVGPLGQYGGPTLTHPLLAGSPAIDRAGQGACPDTDQRGLPRPVEGDGAGAAVCDIGAYEFGNLLPLVYVPLIMRQ